MPKRKFTKKTELFHNRIEWFPNKFDERNEETVAIIVMDRSKYRIDRIVVFAGDQFRNRPN